MSAKIPPLMMRSITSTITPVLTMILVTIILWDRQWKVWTSETQKGCDKFIVCNNLECIWIINRLEWIGIYRFEPSIYSFANWWYYKETLKNFRLRKNNCCRSEIGCVKKSKKGRIKTARPPQGCCPDIHCPKISHF